MPSAARFASTCAETSQDVGAALAARAMPESPCRRDDRAASASSQGWCGSSAARSRRAGRWCACSRGQGHDVAALAVGIIKVQVRERLPAATQTDDLDIILAAAVGNGLDDRVEAGNVATACENADAFLRHDRLSTAALRESASVTTRTVPAEHRLPKLISCSE